MIRILIPTTDYRAESPDKLRRTMKKERMFEELARIDFLDEGAYDKILYDSETEDALAVYMEGKSVCGISCKIPNYLTDHNAIQRIIDMMDDGTLTNYFDELHTICGRPCDVMRELKATCEQKAEAILRAYGKWEDSQ